jgi:hypothetical protein
MNGDLVDLVPRPNQDYNTCPCSQCAEKVWQFNWRLRSTFWGDDWSPFVRGGLYDQMESQ